VEISPESLKSNRLRKKLSQQQIAEYVGVSQRTYGMYEQGVRKPKHDKVVKLMEILEIPVSDITTKAILKIKKTDVIPYFDGKVSAGMLLGIEEGREIPDGEVKVPGLDDCDFALNVWGDSMYPKFCSGEIIVCKSIPLDKELSYVRFGESYVVFCDDGLVLKYLKKGKDNEHLTFESENKHFQPYQVHKSRVKKVFLVKSIITRMNF